jgi:anti-sigma-K factor RskA
MDCKQVEDQLEPYALGALDSRETSLMDSHIDGCPDCSARLRGHSEVVTQLATAVPRLKVPPHVKAQLFARIDEERRPAPPSGSSTRWLGLFSSLGRGLAARSGMAVASALVVVLVVAGIWFNSRLEQIADEKEALADQVELIARDEAEMKDNLQKQRDLAFMAAAGAEVSKLSPTEVSTRSSGMVMAPEAATTALLTATDLRILPEDKEYRVWLVKEGLVYDAGVFPVDSTGYGQIRLTLSSPLRAYEAIIITVERAGGSPGPTGKSVLRGDL